MISSDEVRIIAGKKCYVREDGVRQGWMCSGPNRHDGERGYGGGYEYYRVGNKSIAHHRVLAFAWGMIDDPWDDDVEIDHKIPVRWLNVEWNLQPLPQNIHARITHVRGQAMRQGQRQLTLTGEEL